MLLRLFFISGTIAVLLALVYEHFIASLPSGGGQTPRPGEFRHASGLNRFPTFPRHEEKIEVVTFYLLGFRSYKNSAARKMLHVYADDWSTSRDQGNLVREPTTTAQTTQSVGLITRSARPGT
jgi:hypothetical protein